MVGAGAGTVPTVGCSTAWSFHSPKYFLINSKARSGARIPAEILRRIATGRLKGYRIVQEALGRFRVYHAPDGLSEDVKAGIRGEFGTVMGDPDLEVEFELVDQIMPDPSGKRRLVVCRA